MIEVPQPYPKCLYNGFIASGIIEPPTEFATAKYTIIELEESRFDSKRYNWIES